MHYIQRNLAFVSYYYEIRLLQTKRTLTCQAPVYAHDTSWAGGCGARLWALPAPLCPGTARTYGTTRCRVGPTTCPHQNVTTHGKGDAETTHNVRRAQGKAGWARELARGLSAPSPIPTRQGGDIVALFFLSAKETARLRE